MARLFVGVPTRNRPVLVRKALRSLLDQSVSELRVVVSDNQSAPEAQASVEAFVNDLHDPRVRYYQQPEDRGEYGQGRYFFSECGDEPYFMILHDDDVLDPGYVEVALRRLDAHPDLACFCANPWIFDEEGATSSEQTARYLAEHGRDRQPQGPMEILEPLLRCGFIPISGTVFRTQALRESGLVDEDCHGNYPFEFNLLLRLGERAERAWFEKSQLIGYCFHGGQLRNTLQLRFNTQVIETCIKLLERRRFSGRCERLRRKILAYNWRNYAAIHLSEGDIPSGRRYLSRALRSNPLSYRNWAYAAAAAIVPGRFASWLRARRASVAAS